MKKVKTLVRKGETKKLRSTVTKWKESIRQEDSEKTGKMGTDESTERNGARSQQIREEILCKKPWIGQARIIFVCTYSLGENLTDIQTR